MTNFYFVSCLDVVYLAAKDMSLVSVVLSVLVIIDVW